MQAGRAHAARGNAAWAKDAIQEVITLLRDDHAVLTAVMGAIADAYPGFAVES
jgi:hypothetical protein